MSRGFWTELSLWKKGSAEDREHSEDVFFGSVQQYQVKTTCDRPAVMSGVATGLLTLTLFSLTKRLQDEPDYGCECSLTFFFFFLLGKVKGFINAHDWNLILEHHKCLAVTPMALFFENKTNMSSGPCKFGPTKGKVVIQGQNAFPFSQIQNTWEEDRTLPTGMGILWVHK